MKTVQVVTIKVPNRKKKKKKLEHSAPAHGIHPIQL
jgi:hypothetical protein